jgi:hypothetical protein
MKKIVLIFFLMMFSFTGFSENKYIDVEKARKSIAPAIEQMDTAKVYAGKIGDLLVKEYKMWGLKKTIQVNSNVFLPIALFGILFLVWLKNKK